MSAGEVMAAAEKAAAAPGDQRMEKPPAAVEVLPAVQNYDWGVRGGADNGLVARMANAPPSEGIPFAELWMGTHPKAPLTIVDAGGYAGAAKGMLLSEFLKTNKEFAGEKTVAVYGDQLPYLFKCLSVDKALSIQAHPNKTMAEQLHAKDPANYPDANHKPEMACAVTDFEGLCGFRPLSELAEHLTSCPELRVLVSEPIALQVEAAVALDDVAQGIALKQAFATVMSSASDVIKAQAEAMVARIECKSAELLTSTERLILRINAQFPGDVGLFNIMFLNHCVLKPGEALFLAANLPHAYISGDCMEIMATSDNVVRAGFTPKYKDVHTLVGMLSYSCAKPAVLQGDAEGAGGIVCLYQPPATDVPEFALRRVNMTGISEVDLGASIAPRTVICVSGGGVTLVAQSARGALRRVAIDMRQSTVVVVGAGSSLTLSLNEASVNDGAHPRTSAATCVFVASCHPCFE